MISLVIAMNSWERVLRALNFDGPDKVPIFHAFLPGAFMRYGEKINEIITRYPQDYAPVNQYATMLEDPIYQKGITFKDEWGCVWKNPLGGIAGQVKEFPLENLDNLKTYIFPDPLEENRPFGSTTFDETENFLNREGHEKFVSVDYICYFERLRWLRGFENFLMDILRNRRELPILMDGVLNYNLKRIKRWGETEVDEVFFGDDWGTQEDLMINPKLWRKLFKPRYRKMFDAVHKSGKFVHFHSDGYIIDIIPDLIELGVDIINVQMQVMGVDTLAERFGGKICFRSDLDRQQIMPFGTPRQVKSHVKTIIRAFGSFDGGLIGCGEISQAEPFSNIVAMCEAFEKYGKYPIGKG